MQLGFNADFVASAGRGLCLLLQRLVVLLGYKRENFPCVTVQLCEQYSELLHRPILLVCPMTPCDHRCIGDIADLLIEYLQI